MTNLAGILGTLFDLLIVVFGFGLIIFVHELGHFVAARWAKIRVLGFAIGFGPALFSFRKGLGFRRGSSADEYRKWLMVARAPGTGGPETKAPDEVSPTEYRLNALPLGGYVKMLGQDDLDPGAISADPDSYQSCPAWKRMVVISAGVVANVITATALYVLVFMIGLRVEPAKVGEVLPGRPGSTAISPDVGEPGLRPGDAVVAIEGRKANSYSDMALAAAMAKRGEPLEIVVRREGHDDPLTFAVLPERNPLSGLLDIGVMPARTARLESLDSPAQRAEWDTLMDRIGLAGVEPGMTLVRAGDLTPRGAEDLKAAVRESAGQPVTLAFQADDGRSVEATVRPRAELSADLVQRPDGTLGVFEHLLGLTPVMMVHPEGAEPKQGLRPGDVFARIGTVEYPSLERGIAEIRANRGQKIPLVVLRKHKPGAVERVEIEAKVSRKTGAIGFSAGDTALESTLLGLPPDRLATLRPDEPGRIPAAASIVRRPGTRVLTVDGAPVADLTEIRSALVASTQGAFADGADGATVTLGLELPLPDQGDQGPPVVSVEWALSADDLGRLHALSWEVPFGVAIFEAEQTLLKAESPVHAIGLGLAETNRVMMTTYVTFSRLFEGTVKVEHLKGPVGIAHMGTIIADRGFIWVLFFMALISVNLAVINFLPLPIVDGGQFLMLLYEQFRGRPVPIPVQNAVTMAGLVLIGSMFLIVTFNDVRALLGL